MPDEQDRQPAATGSDTPSGPPRTGRRPGKKGKKPKKKYDSMLGYLWGEWIRPLGIIFVVMGVFRLVAFDWFDVPTGSMEPTILVGDRIAVHKWAYGVRIPFSKDAWIAKWDRPERGDIVVCYSPDQGDEVRLVKRIVAQPGDTIQMVDGRLIINGRESSYTGFEPDDGLLNYLTKQTGSIRRAQGFEFFTETVQGDDAGPGDQHAVMFEDEKPSIRAFPEIEVPEGQYVLIGDNRDNSKDSRAWNLDPSQYGKQIGFIDHRRIHGRAFAVAFSLDKKNMYMPRWSRFFKGLD